MELGLICQNSGGSLRGGLDAKRERLVVVVPKRSWCWRLLVAALASLVVLSGLRDAARCLAA